MYVCVCPIQVRGPPCSKFQAIASLRATLRVCMSRSVTRVVATNMVMGIGPVEPTPFLRAFFEDSY